MGFTFITADYHVAPVLPPKVNCTCLAAMDAYASLLSVVSKTPTPGAPVTLDPEVLNTGSSKIVATLRAYQDPTYSIPASSLANMPVVVVRFYLEVSTKFTRNRITISDCTASNKEQLLNDSTALRPKMNYCDNSTFDTMTERSPNGVTHMDRLSMKKFKFQTSVDVFMQCKIRACAQQPCGVCTGNNPARQLGGTDLSPAEGEMFAPPTQVKVGMNDHNAMVFPDTVNTGTYHTYESGGSPSHDNRPSTTSPIEIASQMTLSSVTASWAIENRAALQATLRDTLQLQAGEELVITGITKINRRHLSTLVSRSSKTERKLQSGGVRIDFTVGVKNQSRAFSSKSMLSQLASGSSSIVSKFTQSLDTQLERRGAAPIGLDSSSLTFAAPEQKEIQLWSSSRGGSSAGSMAANTPMMNQRPMSSSQNYQSSQQQNMGGQTKTTTIQESSDSSSSLVYVMIGVFAITVLMVIAYNSGKKNNMNSEKGTPMPFTAQNMATNAPDAYASKVAAMDAQWASNAGMQHSAWMQQQDVVASIPLQGSLRDDVGEIEQDQAMEQMGIAMPIENNWTGDK
jgi:hypothetical protein